MAIQFPLVFGTATRTPFPTIQQLENQQSRLFGQLASGNLLTSAAVNPAGLAVAEQLTSQVNGLDQAQRNSADATNLLNVAESGLNNQQSSLQQERTLAVQAGDAALAPSELNLIQGQIQQLNQGVNQVGQQTQFNGIALLNGTSTTLKFQSGANAGEQTPVGLPASNAQQLGTSALDVTSSAGQQSALGQLDQAINTTSQNRSDVGAAENSLQVQGDNAATNEVNQVAARSQLADTNIAQASTALAGSLLQQQFSLFALQQQANSFALSNTLLVG